MVSTPRRALSSSTAHRQSTALRWSLAGIGVLVVSYSAGILLEDRSLQHW